LEIINMDEFCDMINTYGGRDKVMKILCYSAKLISGVQIKNNPEMSRKFAIISSKISGARATLRLIDDVPTLQYIMEYGLGEHEHDKTMAALGVLSNIVDLFYYPVEKMCWLIEHKVLNVKNPDKWDVISSTFWVSSIWLNLVRTLRNISNMEDHFICMKKNDKNAEELLEKFMIKQKMEILSALRLSLDFTYAVNTLPKGYLWGGKLEVWQAGLIGTLSSVIGIYQYIKKKKMP
ncbi:peroxisomal membrane protein 11C, partial [Condylostylus longicornis]|uniref:peroxisomal membrane protein 11C n=1 Tax=Condylostylus longicornis TaxID=2530218 RepID=UPI00244DA20F